MNVEYGGASLEEIYGGQDKWKLDHLKQTAHSSGQILLFDLQFKSSREYRNSPKPRMDDKKWDSDHVRLPCAEENELIDESYGDGSAAQVTKQWDVIKQTLRTNIRPGYDLERAIFWYNRGYTGWNFEPLNTFLQQKIEPNEFFSRTLPNLIDLALQLPELVQCSIPLLKKGQNKSVSLSQQQIACLLANAFLCTFPGRNAVASTSEYSSFPSINFKHLFQTNADSTYEKLKCILHYFQRVCTEMPNGVMTFVRRSIPDEQLPDWKSSEIKFTNSILRVSFSGTIEDDGEGLLQVNFADKLLGGSVLSYACVQEPIRFLICPELLCSRLFTESLDDNECLIMKGCERYSSYEGYGPTFKWAGDYKDVTPRDTSKRHKCTIVAIDAIPFRNRLDQYQEHKIKRELNKAYIGFKHDLRSKAPGVATGNWGCGSLGGDKYLKSLLQLMACCANNRPLLYITFKDDKLGKALLMIQKYLSDNQVTIGYVYSWLVDYGKDETQHGEHVYRYIKSRHQKQQRN